MENSNKQGNVGESFSGFTTVAIDAQVRALRVGDHSSALSNGASLIREARRLDQPVLLLRIKTPWDDNVVVPELVREVEQYERCDEIEKNGMGGGEEILAACSHHGFPTGKFVLFGFWLKGCVLSTARQLSLSLPDSEIVVVVDACNAEETEFESLFEDMPNVRLRTSQEIGSTI